VRSCIPGDGHLGLTPQSVAIGFGYPAPGHDPISQERLCCQAEDLQAAGCSPWCSNMCLPSWLAPAAAAVAIPVIGIGAGDDLRRPGAG